MKVPVYSAQLGQDPRGSGARIDARAGGLAAGAVAAGAAQLAGQFGAMAEAERRGRQAIELTRLDTAATREASELVLQLERDPDWSTGRERFDRGIEEIRARWGAQTGDGQVRQEFETRFGRFAEAQRATLGRKLLETGEKQAQGTLAEALDQYSRAAAFAANPLARQQALDDGGAAIERMREAGWIDGAAAVARLKAFRGKVDEAQVLGRLNANTEDATLAVIGELRGGAFGNLDPVQTERLIKTAEAQATRLADRAARDQEKADRLARDAAKAEGDVLLKGIYDAHRQNQPIDALVAQARRHAGVTPAEYSGLLALQDGSDPKDDDRATLADIIPRLDREDVAADLARALRAGKIRGETYTSLMGQNRAALRDDKPASPYKSGRELVNLSLKPPEVLGSGAAQDAARFAQAEALAEFDSWFDANRAADRTAALDEARNVVQRYQAIAFDRMSIAMGLPRNFRGARAAVTPEALDAAERATLQQLDAGGLSRDMAAGELRKIEAWREILSRRPAKKPEVKK